MAPIDKPLSAARRLLALLERAALPRPDEILFEAQEVRFLWHDRKLAVVVDVTDAPELDDGAGYASEGVFP